ncbi:MAG TPA: MaoC/PaaZ C-terminal domain-containing protein [Thermoanaerobaculia bacterium]|nr:MaoC/PaaZ C-terminal domain-containing protein [Thermoanaerobaculia bacterium]
MPVRANAVGRLFGERLRTLEVRHLLAFSAGIGDDSRAVLDDSSDGLIAHPAFCVSLEWPVISAVGARELLGLEPEETRRGVHAAQDSTFHRPLRPGMRVLTRGRFAAVRATSAGALVATRLETIDTASGETLVETWSTSIYRGVTVEGEPRSSGEPPPLPGDDESLGVDGREVSAGIDLPRTFPHVYTECASIWNPIHTEVRIARAAGLPDILVHGTATWALAGREVVRRHAPGDPGRLRRLAGWFRSMVPAGTPIEVRIGTARALADDSRDVAIPFRVLDASGRNAIDRGWGVLAGEETGSEPDA